MPENSAETNRTQNWGANLGSLELNIMNALWSSYRDLSVREVCEQLGPEKNYKTIMTVLNRLVDKDLLERNPSGRAFLYRPHISRKSYLETLAQHIIETTYRIYGQDAITEIEFATKNTQSKVDQFENGTDEVFRDIRRLVTENWGRSIFARVLILSAIITCLEGLRSFGTKRAK